MAQVQRSSAATAGARRAARPGVAAVALMVGGLLAAACGSSSPGSKSSAGNSTSGSTSPPAAAGATTVSTATEPGVGAVLVNSSGRTLYVFSKDAQKAVTCTGGCAAIWPPFIASGTPVAGSGVNSSMLGTVKAPDGKTVVTYDHWPLYTFAEDSGPNQAHGQGIKSFGGSWSTIRASGHMGGQSSAASSTTTTSLYGY